MQNAKRSLLPLILLAVIISMILSGCSTQESALLGKWQETSTRGLVFEFLKDSHLSITALGVAFSGSYKIIDATHLQFQIEIVILPDLKNIIVEYKITDDILTIQWGAVTITSKKLK